MARFYVLAGFMLVSCLSQPVYGGARWLSGRVFDYGCWFETHWRHCAVSLCKIVYPLLSTGSTQEDMKSSRHDLKLLTWA